MKPRALGCNCFAGGFTVGIQKYFDVLAHLECGKYGVASSMLNFPDLPHYTDPETWPVDEFEGADLVYGNPPCAIWSRNNTKGTPWEEDPRLSMIKLQFDLLSQVKPKVWVWESVTGAYQKGKAFVDELTTQANALGYNVSYVLFDGYLVGLPHHRKRFFFVAHNVKIPWRNIKFNQGPTVKEALAYALEAGADPVCDRNDWSDIRRADSIGYLHEVGIGEKLRITYDRWIEEGKIEKQYNKRGFVHGRPSWSILRLPLDEPAPTFTGKTWIHPLEDRPLSYDEYKVLAGYPIDFKLQKAKGEQKISLLARGVMPVVAEWLGNLIRQGIDAGIKEYAGKTEVKFLNSKGLRVRHWHPQLNLFEEPAV